MIRLTFISDLSKLEKRQAWRESYSAACGSTREERDRNASVAFFDRIYGDDVIGDATLVEGCAAYAPSLVSFADCEDADDDGSDVDASAPSRHE